MAHTDERARAQMSREVEDRERDAAAQAEAHYGPCPHCGTPRSHRYRVGILARRDAELRAFTRASRDALAAYRTGGIA